MIGFARERGGNVDDPHKRHPLDFVLWHPSADDEPSWDTMWGPGRPGWHIECSALALRELGTTIDLHGGGTDLIFPHHECERAQSEAATGEPFVRHWMHVAMVYMDGQKMSKSLGNLVFVDALRKEWDPRAIRLAIIEHHYRREWEWDDTLMPRNADRLARWCEAGTGRRQPSTTCVRRSTTTSTRRGAGRHRRRGRGWPRRRRRRGAAGRRHLSVDHATVHRHSRPKPPARRSIMALVSTEGAGKAQQRVRRVVRPVATRLWQFELEGFDRLPAEGPAILCPNHVSFLDSAFLMLHVPRNISFVGKAEYMDSWKTKYLFPWMGMIPIDRSGGDKSQAALDTAEAVLRRGELFGIFPEGTRSRDGILHKGRTGAARLALKIGCPDLSRRHDRHSRDPATRREGPEARAARAAIRIGRPINVERYRNRADDHMVLRQITDELMFEIRELTGQDYRNVYAGKTAETEPTVVAKVATRQRTAAPS